MDEVETAFLESLDDFLACHGKRWSALVGVQGKRQVDMDAVRLEQAGDQIGVLIASVRIDGAVASVFQDIIKTTGKSGRKREHIRLQNFNWRVRAGEPLHILNRSICKIYGGYLKAMSRKQAGIVPTSRAENNNATRRELTARKQFSEYGRRSTQVPTIRTTRIVPIPFVGRIHIIHKASLQR